MTVRLILPILLLALTFGCAKKKEDEEIRITGRNKRGVVNTNKDANDGNKAPISNNQSSGYGFIGSPQHQDAFYTQIQKFVSAAMDPSELGEVSASYVQTSGVRFSGLISVPSSYCTNPQGSAAIQTSKSNVEILIHDSISVKSEGTSDPIEPVRVAFDQASKGQIELVSGQYQFHVEFADTYGVLRLEGVINGNDASGLVRFFNHRRFDGGPAEPPVMETMGSFVIDKNRLLVCQ